VAPKVFVLCTCPQMEPLESWALSQHHGSAGLSERNLDLLPQFPHLENGFMTVPASQDREFQNPLKVLGQLGEHGELVKSPLLVMDGKASPVLSSAHR
jgi:hypothetical protein